MLVTRCEAYGQTATNREEDGRQLINFTLNVGTPFSLMIASVVNQFSLGNGISFFDWRNH